VEDRLLNPKPGGVRALVLAFGVYLALTLGLAAARGAFSSDLCAFEDEPAHVVTGLMVRDWVRAGFPAPLAYAHDYYLHYPKVALGQWPPAFYVVQGLWMLLFGASTFSLIGLMGTLTAGVATLVFAALRRSTGAWAAAIGGLLFLALPSVQAYGAMVMTEAQLALLCTAALLSFGRYLDGGRARDALLFGLLAGCAALTKGNALALAGVPPLATLLTGRWDRWRRPALWGAAGLVILLAAPWYATTLGISQGSWVGGREPSGEYARAALTFYGRGLRALGGVALLVGAGLGAWRGLRSEGGRGVSAALIAWPPSLLLLHGVVPSSLDERHLILLAPALCILAVRGAVGLGRPGPRNAGLAAGLLVALVLLERAELPRKEWHGFTDIAVELQEEPIFNGRAILVVSDVAGEGALVAAAALADDVGRPSRYVLRASKALARSDWVGRGYSLRFEDAEALAAWFEFVPVAVILQDLAPRQDQRFAHHEQVAEALALHPERWQADEPRDLVKNGVRHPGALRVWRRVGMVGKPHNLDADWLLGRELPGF
jgi:Dolichyl-phosphate-mannose-protein mannosyltransferase